MKEGLFHFKEFSLSHSKSSMKIGVDAVLLGSWVTPIGNRCLDVGTGCGVMALMLAQRNRTGSILGIDIHNDSVEEAKLNFLLSPWKNRLEAQQKSFSEVIAEVGKGFDLIVSNPPYFDSGVNKLNKARLVARHKGALSPEIIVENSSTLLNPSGRLGLIVPSEFFSSLRNLGISSGLCLSRGLFIKDHPSSSVKRVLLEFIKDSHGSLISSLTEKDISVLTMFDENRDPTVEYRQLTHDFYLKF